MRKPRSITLSNENRSETVNPTTIRLTTFQEDQLDLVINELRQKHPEKRITRSRLIRGMCSIIYTDKQFTRKATKAMFEMTE